MTLTQEKLLRASDSDAFCNNRKSAKLVSEGIFMSTKNRPEIPPPGGKKGKEKNTLTQRISAYLRCIAVIDRTLSVCLRIVKWVKEFGELLL